MEELFPGFIDRLHSHGVVQCPIAKEATLLYPGIGALPHKADVAPDVVVQMATRHLIEGTLREFIATNPTMESAVGKGARDLLVGDGRVHGVQLSDGTMREADLVVDCMGRTSCIADWLASHGYNKPETSTLTAEVTYVCRQVLPERANICKWSS